MSPRHHLSDPIAPERCKACGNSLCGQFIPTSKGDIKHSERCPFSRIKELENEIVKLKRACAVLYWGSPKLCRLAENEYSGCASTQRECCDELRRALERNV